MNHYYLMASLPALALEGTPPIDLEALRAACAGQLSGADAEIAEAVIDGRESPAQHPFLARRREWETQLRNAVARHRAAHLKVDPEPHLRPAAGFDVNIEKGVADAMARPDPLHRELALDHLRWRLLEETAGLNQFGFEALLAYALKLRMIVRWAELQEQRGQAAFDAATAVAV